jgi:hypothetical protein
MNIFFEDEGTQIHQFIEVITSNNECFPNPQKCYLVFIIYTNTLETYAISQANYNIY